MTDSSSSVSSLFVGIDVAKDKLDPARSDSNQVFTFTNDAAGIGKIVDSLRSTNPQGKAVVVIRIVVEATGGLERPLVAALLDAELPVSLVNPRQVRHFAKGLGIQAKTDAIDAGVLMDFARRAEPRLAEKRTANQTELNALVTCRRQLTHVRTEQTNRRSRTSSKMAIKSIDAMIRVANKQIESLDQQIRKLIESDDDMDSIDKLLRTVPGVGAVLSSTLLSGLSELGTTDRQRINALAGVAPFNNDSGPRQGKRAIRGGRASVRAVLYMATVAAMRCNPVIRVFAERLKKAGKANKVAITACMRKLLGLLNAMIRDGLRWDQLKVTQ